MVEQLAGDARVLAQRSASAPASVSSARSVTSREVADRRRDDMKPGASAARRQASGRRPCSARRSRRRTARGRERRSGAAALAWEHPSFTKRHVYRRGRGRRESASRPGMELIRHGATCADRLRSGRGGSYDVRVSIDSARPMSVDPSAHALAAWLAALTSGGARSAAGMPRRRRRSTADRSAPPAVTGMPGTIGPAPLKVALILPLTPPAMPAPPAQSMQQCRRTGARRIQHAQHPAHRQRRRRHGAGRARRRAGRRRRGREARPRPAVRAFGRGGGAGRASRRNCRCSPSRPTASVATHGVYLLSFLPESDVERIVSYAVSAGQALLRGPAAETGYGSVVEGAFQQAVAKAGGRVVGLERYAVRQGQDDGGGRPPRAAPLPQADALLLPDTPEDVADASSACSRPTA